MATDSDRLLAEGVTLRLRHADTEEEREVRYAFRGARGWKLLEDRFGSLEAALGVAVALPHPVREADLQAVVGLVCRAIARSDLRHVHPLDASDLQALAVDGLTQQFGRADLDEGARELEAIQIATKIARDHLVQQTEKRRVDDLCILMAAGLQRYAADLTIAGPEDRRVRPEDMIDWIDLRELGALVRAVNEALEEGMPAARPRAAQQGEGADVAILATRPVDPEVAWAEAEQRRQERGGDGGDGGPEGNASGAPNLATSAPRNLGASTGSASTTSPPSSSTAATSSSGTA